MVTAINASNYTVELRDKDGHLKNQLTPYISKINWEWNRIGGCGRCSITLNKAYRDLIFDARDDIQIRVPNLEVNHLIGVDFEIWTAGASAAPDNWTAGGGGMSVARESTIVKTGTYSAKVTRAGTDCDINQIITSDIYAGRTMTFGAWVYATVADRGRLILNDGVDSTYSSNHTGDSTWQFLTVTKTFSAAATRLYCGCGIGGGDTSAYFDNAICVEGSSIAGAILTPRSKLVYRGYLANIVPTLKINQEVTLDVRGYFDLLKKIIVHTTGDTRTYTSKTVAYIADDIADTFIVAKTPITIAGALTAGDFTADTLEFLGTVEDALRTLSELQGDIEYGVNENLVFYWKTESTTINRKFFVGNNISVLERRVKWDELVNKIYLVGGDVTAVKYKKTGQNTDSQSLYGLNEEIINNSSITTDGVAAQYMTAILTERAIPQFSIRAQIKNTDLRLEDIVPMGLVTFYDATYDKTSLGDTVGDIIGATVTIISSSIANPSIIYAKAHGYQTGQSILIAGHTSVSPDINTTHTITCVDRDTGTDLACADGDAAAPVVSSASHNFVAADVGHYLHISAGTDWTAGWYAIVSCASNEATLSGPCGANGALSGGTWQLGEDSFSIPVNVTDGGVGGTAVSASANGSDIIIGLTADGGDNVFIGGQYSAQVDRISYELSNTPGRFNIEIQLGDTVLETAAKIKRLELALASVTQY